MALPTPHPLSDMQITAFSASVSSSAVPACITAPFRGKIIEIGVSVNQSLAGDATVSTFVNTDSTTSVNVTGGTFTIGSTVSGPGKVYSTTPTANNTFNEGDCIVFLPGGGTGTASGQFYAKMRKI
jgi:hypothetical protein